MLVPGLPDVLSIRMGEPRIRIAGSGAICPIGTGVAQIWAAVRAGISRTAFSSLHGRVVEPFKMALIPDEVLTALPPELLSSALTPSQRRMLSLSAHALKEALAEPPAAPTPLFVGLPETPRTRRVVGDEQWMEFLIRSLEPSIDKDNSRVFSSGRAAVFEALKAACETLRAGRCTTALVGGVDTFYDAGHRYSDSPALGEGVANAIASMRAQWGQTRSAAQVVFAAMNGEAFGAKAWGVAQLRHNDVISSEAMIEHPADCFGDLGAALGAMMLVLADASLVLSHRDPPAIAWAESDRGVCGCAWLDVDQSLS